MKQFCLGTKLNRIHILLIALFFIGFIFDFRPLVGLTTILLAINAFLWHRLDTGKWFNRSYFNLFTTGLLLFFTIQALALFYTHDTHAGFSTLETNLGLIILPIGASYSSLVNPESFDVFMKYYLGILFAATLIALSHAIYLFSHSGDISFFFYHPLVSLYSNHAIQFSIIVFFGILFLIRQYANPVIDRNRGYIMGGLIYFSIFIFLLSSKLVILFYFLYLCWLLAFTRTLFSKNIYRIGGVVIFVLLSLLIVFTKAPISQRLKEEARTDIDFFHRPLFNQSDYFTGVQFRLLSWRFVYEILNEKKAWFLGVSPGDSQKVLNEKYTQEHLYMGGTGSNEKGYGAYHTHNQFLQSLLETGMIGLIAFIMVCAGLIVLTNKSGNPLMWIYTLLLLCFCFTDAPLKTQYGIVLFVFFPLLLYKGSRKFLSAIQSL